MAAFFRSALMRLARSGVSRFLFKAGLLRLLPWLPMSHLIETEHLLAFRHPKPSYPFHVLLVPKKPIESLMELPSDDPFLIDLMNAVKELVKIYELRHRGYRLIVNGGPNQDVPQLHYHLVANTPPDR